MRWFIHFVACIAGTVFFNCLIVCFFQENLIWLKVAECCITWLIHREVASTYVYYIINKISTQQVIVKIRLVDPDLDSNWIRNQ
jgi:hypothetical protein